MTATIRSLNDVSPETRRAVERRLRELDEQFPLQPKPEPTRRRAAPTERTDAERERHLNQLIANACEAQRQFILDVMAGSLGEASDQITDEAAQHAEGLIKKLEQQILEMRTQFAQLLTAVAVMQAHVIRDQGANVELPELPKMREVN
jgi:hypothetical protein